MDQNKKQQINVQLANLRSQLVAIQAKAGTGSNGMIMIPTNVSQNGGVIYPGAISDLAKTLQDLAKKMETLVSLVENINNTD